MPLDVYVGPLTLYYADQWENKAQKAARLVGGSYHKLRTRDVPDAVRDPEQIRPAMVGWQRGLNEALKAYLLQPLEWSEDVETYFSTRPDFEGLGALVLWAAYEDHRDLPRPEQYRDFTQDPAYLRSVSKDAVSSYPAVIHDIEFWLPADFGFNFKAEAPHGAMTTFSSAFGLRQQLHELNDRTWAAEADEFLSWGRRRWPGADAPLEDLAKFGFAEMYSLAVLACEHRLPMKLDY
jgi:hypothetical protein